MADGDRIDVGGGYKLSLANGEQRVNGVTSGVFIDHADRTVVVTNDGDPLRTARRAYLAGQSNPGPAPSPAPVPVVTIEGMMSVPLLEDDPATDDCERRLLGLPPRNRGPLS